MADPMSFSAVLRVAFSDSVIGTPCVHRPSVDPHRPSATAASGKEAPHNAGVVFGSSLLSLPAGQSRSAALLGPFSLTYLFTPGWRDCERRRGSRQRRLARPRPFARHAATPMPGGGTEKEINGSYVFSVTVGR